MTQPNRFETKGPRLNTTVAIIAETPGSATLEEQRACLNPDDIVVLAGKRAFNTLAELLTKRGLSLKSGDRVRLFDLSCLALSTVILIRMLAKLLKAGITVEIIQPGITLEPHDEGQKHALLTAIDNHYRHVHGIKSHMTETGARGRRRLLTSEQLPDIRERLAQPGATQESVALELGVARSTLFNFLERVEGGGNIKRRQKSERPQPISRARRGRPLADEQLPDIREKLAMPGATRKSVALELGVARSTLFNYLERLEGDDGHIDRGNKAVGGQSEDGGD